VENSHRIRVRVWMAQYAVDHVIKVIISNITPGHFQTTER